MPAASLAALLQFEDAFETVIVDGLGGAVECQVVGTRATDELDSPRVAIAVNIAKNDGHEIEISGVRRDRSWRLSVECQTISERGEVHAGIVGACRAYFANFAANLAMDDYLVTSMSLVSSRRHSGQPSDEHSWNDITSDFYELAFSIKDDAFPS